MTTDNKRRSKVIVWSALALTLSGAAVAWFILDPGFRTVLLVSLLDSLYEISQPGTLGSLAKRVVGLYVVEVE